jgi:hypothetical protein
MPKSTPPRTKSPPEPPTAPTQPVQTLTSPKAVSVVGARSQNGVVVFMFASDDGRSIRLPVLSEILPAMTALCKSALGIWGPKNDGIGIISQPIPVTAARAAVGPAREPILDLTIEGSGHLPITFPRSAIEPLRTALAVLYEMSKPASQAH